MSKLAPNTSFASMADKLLVSRDQMSPAETLRSIGQTAGKILGSGAHSVHALISNIMENRTPALAPIPVPAQDRRLTIQRKF